MYESMTNREIDIAVAENVFNARVITKDSKLSDMVLHLLVDGYGFNPMDKSRTLLTAFWRHTSEQAWEACPRFTENISAAFEVVQKMHENEHPVVIDNNDYRGWYDVGFYIDDVTLVTAQAETAPKAICIAALKSVKT
jgi:hypothetical protein